MPNPNLNEFIVNSIKITFEGKPIKPILAQEILWRTDRLYINNKNTQPIFQNIVYPLFARFPAKEKNIILQKRLFESGKHNSREPSHIINTLITETLKNKLHSLPLSAVHSYAVSHYDDNWNYGNSSFLSWTGHWTKTKIWLQKSMSFGTLIEDWKIIGKEFPVNVTIQYENCQHFGRTPFNCPNTKLTIIAKNGKIDWTFDEPKLRENDNSYSCMRKPPLPKLIESFNYVCSKFHKTNPTSRIPHFTSKKSKIVASV